jgi:FKBP-type peptidyl-prolyl cis-trans isomerase 2
MHEGQTLAVRIPAKDAYGESGAHTLSGQDLIFLIEVVSID